jgi:hypothetical protein
MHEHNRQVHRLAFNPVRPAVFLSASSDATVRLWDLRFISNDKGVTTCRSRQKFLGHSEAIRDVRWRPFEGYEFATGSDSGVIQRWDIRKENAPLLKIHAHEKPCHSVDWHPDGKHLLSGGRDGFVKIYDFSMTEKRQKPLRQIRAPQAIMNARWRPPCWSLEEHESGDWQSTQLVTSYDNTDPRIHLWELKRPNLPFREFDKFDGACTDMLWHSKDLLWTVGNDGVFSQSDIHFAPQVVQRRAFSSFDWSCSSGKLRFGTRKRSTRSGSGFVDTSDFLISNSKERGTSGEKPVGSRSFTDDDENLLSTSFRKRQSRVSSSRSSKSLGGTPPSAEDGTVAVALNRTLDKCGKYEPMQRQVLAMVILGASSDPLVQKLYAKSTRQLLGLHQEGPTSMLLEKIDTIFENNARLSEMALMYRLAQSWRIAGLTIIDELRTRAEARVQERIDDAASKKEEAARQAETEAEFQASTLEGKADKMKSHLFKGVVEAEGRNGSPETDSTSNMTTPLARPLPDSPLSTHTYREQTSPPRMIPLNDEELRPLPPSILSTQPLTMDLKILEEGDDTLLFKSLNEQFDARKRSRSTTQSSVSPPLPPSIESISTSKPEGDRSAPRAIEGKAEWRKEKSSSRSVSPNMPSFDRVAEARRAALRDYKAPQRTLVNFDSPSGSAQGRLLRASFDPHDSSESFPMFSASTDSSHRIRSLGGSFPASQYSDGSDAILEPWEIEEASRHDQVRPDHLPTTTSDSPETDQDSFMHVNLSKSSTGELSSDGSTRIFRPSHLLVPLRDPSQRTLQSPDLSIGGYIPSDFTHSLSQTRGASNAGEPPKIPADANASTGYSPWGATHIIRHLLSFHTTSQATIHLPAQLLSLIQPYLNVSHTLIPSTICAQIFASYNDVLLRLGLVIEAAELRKLCAHLYPSVYAYAQEQQDTYINVYCHSCNKPFENRKRNNFVCETCGSKQAPCPVCLSVKPPTEWALEADSTSARMKGASLWAWCQGCGHGGHVECMERWLSNTEISEGGCASQGCLHDCGPGPRRREKARTREEKEREKSRGRAKRDSWTVPESKAVERTRSVLVNQSQGGSSGSTTPTASQPGTVKEAKKVRLVIPSEEETAGGIGGRDGVTVRRESGRRGGLLRWGSDGASERERMIGRDGDADVDSPVSRVSNMAASVD